MSLTEAIAAAVRFRKPLDPGDIIDQASGFSAMHLDLLIEWASTCSDVIESADAEETLRDMDVTQLGDAGLAHFYFSEQEIDPGLEGEIGKRLSEEITRRGLSDEQLGALVERTRQAHEAARAIETSEREAPPHFPDDIEIPKPG